MRPYPHNFTAIGDQICLVLTFFMALMLKIDTSVEVSQFGTVHHENNRQMISKTLDILLVIVNVLPLVFPACEYLAEVCTRKQQGSGSGGPSASPSQELVEGRQQATTFTSVTSVSVNPMQASRENKLQRQGESVEAAVDPKSGRTYYHNKLTQKTAWDAAEASRKDVNASFGVHGAAEEDREQQYEMPSEIAKTRGRADVV